MPHSALVWPPGIWAGEAQTPYQNVNPCSNDIVNPNECYSNWLMGNSRPVLKGVRSKQSHLPSGQVFLRVPCLLPIGACSYSVLWSNTWKPSKITAADNNHYDTWSDMLSGPIIIDKKYTDTLDVCLHGMLFKFTLETGCLTKLWGEWIWCDFVVVRVEANCIFSIFLNSHQELLWFIVIYCFSISHTVKYVLILWHIITG